MTFKYDLTEFCTSIKPACFQWIFNKGYEYAIYMDPDIYVFSSLDIIYKKLSLYDIALTPQIAGIHTNYTGEHPEWAMNVNGIFNLGFCGMRNTEISQTVLAWWKLRLKMNASQIEVLAISRTKMDGLASWLLGNEHLYVFTV